MTPSLGYIRDQYRSLEFTLDFFVIDICGINVVKYIHLLCRSASKWPWLIYVSVTRLLAQCDIVPSNYGNTNFRQNLY